MYSVRGWMRNVLLCGCVVMAACADSMEKSDLENLPVYLTPTYGLPYAVAPDVPADLNTLALFLDRDWYDWTTCMAAHYPNAGVDFEAIKAFRHILVPYQFECKYHNGTCGGEYTRNPARIYLAYESDAGTPLLYDQHEWSDIAIPATEDEAGRTCTRNL